MDQTTAIRAGKPVDTKLDSLLSVSREVATEFGEVSETTWNAARDAGWSDHELTELYVHVVVNMLTKYFRHYVRTELDVLAPPPLT